MKQLKAWLLLAGAAVVLAACGGGGDGGGAAPPVQQDPLSGVPVEATQSVAAWMAYIAALVMTTNADERDPLTLPAGTPASLPVDDQSEPIRL